MEISGVKILILGGTGVLSTDFTKLCLDLNNEVFLVNRGKREAFIDKRAKLIISDLRNESKDRLRELFYSEHYDVVVDFLSYIPKHMEKTLYVLSERFDHYVFISSATVYKKNSPNEVMNEDCEIGNDKWDYAYQKSLCEEYLAKQEINYTIIRPYVTFGVSRIPFPIIPDNFHYSLIQRIKAKKPVIMLDEGAAVCTLTSTKDFANVLYKLLLNKRAYRECYNITSNNRQTWYEVYLILCDILNSEQNICSVSIEDIHKYMPEFENILIGDKGQNMLFDNSKVLSVVGENEFEYSLKEALQESITYFEENNNMQGIDYKWDGKCDYLARKKGFRKMNLLSGNRSKSNSPILYTIMVNPILRIMYDTLRLIKQRIHN